MKCTILWLVKYTVLRLVKISGPRNFLWLAKSTLLELGKDLLRLAIWLVRVSSASRGDDGPANGRVEAEVGQIKRRLRVLLATSKLELQDWPGVARWAGEERLRRQLQKVGVPSKPMVPLGERVVVKTKRWHKQGLLAAPFKSMVLMGPSPNMTNGWVLRDGRKVQHARAVVRPAEAGEKAVMELYDASTRRVTGKQPSYLEDRKVPQPLQHDDLPQLLREDLALDDSHDVWGEAGNADLGEDVLSLGYSPDDFPDELHGDQPHDGDQDGSVDVEPALRTMWAGGSPTPLQRLLQRLWWIQTLQTPLWRQLQRHPRPHSVHVRAVGSCSLMGRIATFALVLHQGRGPHSRA